MHHNDRGTRHHDAFSQSTQPHTSAHQPTVAADPAGSVGENATQPNCALNTQLRFSTNAIGAYTARRSDREDDGIADRYTRNALSKSLNSPRCFVTEHDGMTAGDGVLNRHIGMTQRTVLDLDQHLTRPWLLDLEIVDDESWASRLLDHDPSHDAIRRR